MKIQRGLRVILAAAVAFAAASIGARDAHALTSLNYLDTFGDSESDNTWSFWGTDKSFGGAGKFSTAHSGERSAYLSLNEWASLPDFSLVERVFNTYAVSRPRRIDASVWVTRLDTWTQRAATFANLQILDGSGGPLWVLADGAIPLQKRYEWKKLSVSVSNDAGQLPTKIVLRIVIGSSIGKQIIDIDDAAVKFTF